MKELFLLCLIGCAGNPILMDITKRTICEHIKKTDEINCRTETHGFSYLKEIDKELEN